MTDEILAKANQLQKDITETGSMEQIVDAMMQHPDLAVTIGCIGVGVGSVKLKVDEIYSALEYIRDVLREKKEELEDDYRML